MQQASTLVPALSMPVVLCRTVHFKTCARTNCASQSFCLASLDSSLYTREPLRYIQLQSSAWQGEKTVQRKAGAPCGRPCWMWSEAKKWKYCVKRKGINTYWRTDSGCEVWYLPDRYQQKNMKNVLEKTDSTTIRPSLEISTANTIWFDFLQE